MNKTSLKFFGSALLLVLVGAGAVWGIDYYQKIHSPEYQAELKMRELEARAKADTYGGSTPEETLALFIDALKKGDIDLASKYFVVDEQEKWKVKLQKVQNDGNLANALNEFVAGSFTKKADNEAFFTLADKKNHVISEMVMVFNKFTNKWKILEL